MPTLLAALTFALPGWAVAQPRLSVSAPSLAPLSVSAPLALPAAPPGFLPAAPLPSGSLLEPRALVPLRLPAAAPLERSLSPLRASEDMPPRLGRRAVAPPEGEQLIGPLDGIFDGASPRAFLERQRGTLEAALKRQHSLPEALRARQLIDWSRAYLPDADHDAWTRIHAAELGQLDAELEAELEAEFRRRLERGGREAAAELLESARRQAGDWAALRPGLLQRLAALLPDVDRAVSPLPPPGPPAAQLRRLERYLQRGEIRQAEYLLQHLERTHADWPRERRELLDGYAGRIRDALFTAFEQRKALHSPTELRRMEEYTQELARGRNAGHGLADPGKQDPESLMCTVMSLCNAIKATTGFEDPSMDQARFAELVRKVLKDPEIGIKRGLSTHRIRALLRKLGIPHRVHELQERLRRPFREEELLAELRPDRAVIAVLIIAQKYEEDQDIRREEHKVFLRDAFYSPTEKRWVFVAGDSLIGRNSFYTWPELRPFLHKLVVMETGRPLPAP